MTNEQENKCHAIIHSHLPTASSVSSFPSPCAIPQIRPNDREIVHTLFRPSLKTFRIAEQAGAAAGVLEEQGLLLAIAAAARQRN